ncbi:MAG: hypothetical protein WEA99_07865 [Brumimicrobium sp.]
MKIKNKLIELGLTDSEIEELGLDQAITYFRFHHKKNYGVSSVLFSEMESDKLSEFHRLATKSGLKINSRISSALTFFCYENEKQERLNKAKEYGTVTITPEAFKKIFSIQEYSLQGCDLIFDPSINKEFRVAKPLSNFDHEVEVNSFSLSSDRVYSVNLFKQTCTCDEFINSTRSDYKAGDIRRFCKHLMDDYEKSFGLTGLTIIQKGLIQNKYSVKTHLDKITISSLELPVYINRDEVEDWWNIYAAIDGKTYSKYGFDPIEERFAYNDKPHGHVKTLREELQKYKQQFSKQPKEKVSQKNKSQKKVDNTGCPSILLIPLISTLVYLLLK